jgi:hypothetical protein
MDGPTSPPSEVKYPISGAGPVTIVSLSLTFVELYSRFSQSLLLGYTSLAALC